MALTTVLGTARIFCSDRHGGVSASPYDTANVGDRVGDDAAAVAENRRRVAAAAGLPDPAAWVWLEQVHGAAVYTADRVAASRPRADAAVTVTRGLPLAVVTADCAPLVLVAGDAVAVVHAGHRGLAAGVVEATVGRLREHAHERDRVRAFLGPCIRVARYEFGAEDLACLAEQLGPSVVGETSDGRPAFDLAAGVRATLARAGVEAFVDSDVCTSASPDYFSYRRDGTTGRQVTVVWRP
jgi:YfiH family protein